MEKFGAICAMDQLEIMHGGIIQVETATVMMTFDEELQMTNIPPTGKLLILLCSDVYWKNTQRASSTPVMALHDYPQNNGKMP